MQTSGHGNEALMILVPVGVLVVCSIILFGGPADALEAVNRIVGEIARTAIRVTSAMLS